MKRKLSFIIAVTMLISGCNTDKQQSKTGPDTEAPTTVITEIKEEQAECTDFDYTTYLNSVTIKKYIGNDKNVIVPAEIEGKPVTKFTEYFLKDTDIEEITFSEGITKIPSIKDCDSLKIINLPSTTESIETFRFCNGLEEININENELYKSVDGVLYSADGLTLTAFPIGRTDSFIIPKTVKTIGRYAFANSKLSEIILYNKIEPHAIKVIEEYAFWGCTGLEDVILPVNVEEIGFSAFEGSSLKSIVLPKNLKKVDSRAFADTDLTELYLPDKVRECGNNIADNDVLISVSFPFNAFSHVNNRKNTVFRNENTLERAIRYAGDPEQHCKGRIFIDMNMDNFPEMVEIYEYYKQFSYFDFTENEWKFFIEEFKWKWWLGLEPTFDKYYMIFNEEEKSCILYSDIFYFPTMSMEQETEYIPLQEYVTIKNGIFEIKTKDSDFYDVNSIEIIKTFDFEKILEENNTAVTYQQFELVMDRFVYEPDDEIDESSPFEWRDEKITELPYFNAYYPDYVRLKVMGKDMLKGEKYPKINYNDGVLYLDNAVIHASEKFIFYCTGMDTLTIDISGECYIIADNIAKIFNVKDIPVTIQGDGTLYTTKITADTINLNGNVKLVQYDIEEYYGDEQIYDNNLYKEHNYFYSINYLSINDNSSVECTKICGTDLEIRENGNLKCSRISYATIYTYDKALLEVGQGKFHTGWTEALYLNINDNSVVNLKGTGSVALTYKNMNNHLNLNIHVSENGVLNVEGREGGEAINTSRYDDSGGSVTLYDNGTINVNGGIICLQCRYVNFKGGTLNLNSDKGGKAINIVWDESDYIIEKDGFEFIGNVTEFNLAPSVNEYSNGFREHFFNTSCESYEKIYIHVEPIEEEQ